MVFPRVYRDQLARFLAAAEPRGRPGLTRCSWSWPERALRLGEALALRWEDLDPVANGNAGGACARANGELDTPTSGHGRIVDLGAGGSPLLKRGRAAAREVGLRPRR